MTVSYAQRQDGKEANSRIGKNNFQRDMLRTLQEGDSNESNENSENESSEEEQYEVTQEDSNESNEDDLNDLDEEDPNEVNEEDPKEVNDEDTKEVNDEDPNETDEEDPNEFDEEDEMTEQLPVGATQLPEDVVPQLQGLSTTELAGQSQDMVLPTSNPASFKNVWKQSFDWGSQNRVTMATIPIALIFVCVWAAILTRKYRKKMAQRRNAQANQALGDLQLVPTEDPDEEEPTWS